MATTVEIPIQLPVYSVSILILGDYGVGKTSFIDSYLDGSFSTDYTPTFGLDKYEKVQIVPGSGRRTIGLQFWDISGRSLENKNLTDTILLADIIMLMYDITHIGSFLKLFNTLNLIRNCFGIEGDNSNNQLDIRLPYLVLIANKSDLELSRTVSINDHLDFFQKGRFNSHVSISCFKSEFIKQWLTFLIADLQCIPYSVYNLKNRNQLVTQSKQPKKHSLIDEAKKLRANAIEEDRCAIL
ncbi:P-loop containing nucleoside triphosphate hydrolase protein [Globomyces pollinis-pini]|nr:P-loop containing nucleoside triphosphate hydrolase protein [Globomyces pollinis-pini]